MSCFFIGGSKQCGNIVLRNEQGTEDALCLGCDELLFARYKEQEDYLQSGNQNMYFRAPGSHSPDLHTVLQSRRCYLLYSRIEGAFLNRLLSCSSSGNKRWTAQQASSWRTQRPWRPNCSLSTLSFIQRFLPLQPANASFRSEHYRKAARRIAETRSGAAEQGFCHQIGSRRLLRLPRFFFV